MKKLLAALLAAAMLLGLCACGAAPAETPAPAADTAESGDAEPAEEKGIVAYERENDEDVYQRALGSFSALMEQAEAAETPDERYMLLAQAEAALLDSAVIVPTTAGDVDYILSRVAPGTTPSVLFGHDANRRKGMVISDAFLTVDEREALWELWRQAAADGSEYDPAAYLTEKGHTILTTYTSLTSFLPSTLDWQQLSAFSDLGIAVNCVDGLVEYDVFGRLQPAIAESWDVSADGTVYTFHLRGDVSWVTYGGKEFAKVTAGDFAAGFRHRLDVRAGTEPLTDSIVVGAAEYGAQGGLWDDVGCRALDDHTLEIVLEKPVPSFPAMLTSAEFLPMCDAFYRSQGGVYGVEEYAAATAGGACTYGQTADLTSQVYCGPFMVQELEKDFRIRITANPRYYRADQVTLKSLEWIVDSGGDPEARYRNAVDGVTAELIVSDDIIRALAESDGLFDEHAFTTEPGPTTIFGALNLNRGALSSGVSADAPARTEQQKVDTHAAMQNKHFRKALQYAFDRETRNIIRCGELGLANLRNTVTAPGFVSLSGDVTDANGHTFHAGTCYGDMVQHYLKGLGVKIDVHDGTDGWFDPELAANCLAKAKAELGEDISYPIRIDLAYFAGSADRERLSAEASAYKNVIEKALGAENVQVVLTEIAGPLDFDVFGLRAADEQSGDYDIYIGFAGRPAAADPAALLERFL